MEVLHACCCGLDVHKKGVTACVLWAEGKGKKRKEKRQFGTMTRDLLALADWLRACGVTHTPAQLPRCSGSPNWFMLTPISAISPLAVTQSTPGMVPNCSISSSKGRRCSPISCSSRAIFDSTNSRCSINSFSKNR